MNLNLAELKSLATAANLDRNDYFAANDYGMAMPPAMALELIAEIERHRQVKAEGCKPESSIPPFGMPCVGAATYRSLDKAGGFKPDLDLSQLAEAAAWDKREYNEATKLHEAKTKLVNVTAKRALRGRV